MLCSNKATPRCWLSTKGQRISAKSQRRAAHLSPGVDVEVMVSPFYDVAHVVPLFVVRCDHVGLCRKRGGERQKKRAKPIVSYFSCTPLQGCELRRSLCCPPGRRGPGVSPSRSRLLLLAVPLPSALLGIRGRTTTHASIKEANQTTNIHSHPDFKKHPFSSGF